MDQVSRLVFDASLLSKREQATGLKRCSRCKESLAFENFDSHKTRGLQTYCRPCSLALRQEYQRAHAERLAVKRELAHLAALRGDLGGVKTCRVCGVEKPRLEFYAHRDTKDRRATHCKECQRRRARERREQGLGVRTVEESQAYYAAHRDEQNAATRAWRIRQYGLTVEQYDAMVARQDGRCAICGERGEDTGRPLGIDHCHESNAVRGLLCNFCNSLLGFARDREDVLLTAVTYLRASQREAAS